MFVRLKYFQSTILCLIGSGDENYRSMKMFFKSNYLQKINYIYTENDGAETKDFTF